MGADMLQKLIQAHSGHKELSLLRNTAELVNKSFIAGFKLSTGLSMEPLWLCFRPTPFCDEAMLNNSMELEKLANRFDSLRWRASASLNDLRQASMTLERAYELVKGAQLTSSGLVDDLKSVISGLEKRIPIESTEVTPYFAEEFERLRQVHFLRHRGRQSMADEAGRDLLMLSNIPTIISMAFASPNQAALALQSVDALACHGPFVWDGKFAASLWSKLQHIHSVPLSALALLETEFPIMGKHVSSLAAEISMDSLIELNKVLLDLIFEVFNALDPKLRPVAIRVSEAASRQLAADHTQPTSHALRIPEFHDLFDSIETSHVKEITASHLAPAIVAIAAASYNLACCSHFSALAWSHFSLGAIKLYVPDRVFDPQIRPRLEREFTKRLQDGLGQRISALEVFEAKFSGQTTNIRVEQLQQELARIDLPPEATKPIFRPEKSELGRVHAEFTNILRTVASVDLLAGAESLDSELAIANDRAQFVRENIQLLVNRLSGRFEAYQDMTRPVISVLRCCLIGLSLCDASTSKALSSPALDLVKVTPFAGGYCGSQESLIAVRSFEFLNYATAVIAIEGISKIQNPIRQSIFECFHQFYDEWTNRLEADKKAEAENTSLYRFRGSAEDEEQVDAEEFNELFPSYNDDGSDVSPVRPRDQVREKSIKVARAHQKLFLVPETPLKALSNLCISTGRYVASDLKNHAYIDRDSNGILLPATVLFLHQKKELMDSSTNEQYNFYTSENFSQVRLLVLLTNKLKSRFRDLQMIDEIGHMQPLADVIQSCDKVLSLVHTEPLAKILPNVEHLHAQVYEWQFGGWASRVHSVLELHNELTDTIIRWRRLELSTWSNLFEMERRKCEEDAYSWWFVAYQVVIAVPLSMVDSPSELGGYAVSLTQNLELYFSASIVGQFSARLALLNQLKLHLQLLTNDYPNLEVIYQAVNNFISFYTRYEKPANEWIMKGRAPIDKSMKDVLLMASWKDTNINALRESARKSHMKLFRIIRKFRNVLGHEMKLVIQQGLPDETVETYSANPQDSVRSSKFPIINLAQLADLSSRWLEKNRRLVNSNKTVNKMRGIVQSPALAAEVASVLENHVTSLDICIAELRKETPPFLTDENKELVKHLKTRKRKVFADTLRDLRLMGIRFNLAQNELSKQDSLPVIMASTPPVDLPQSPTLTAANYHFHKVLDLAPKARNALQEHSDELTAAEVARSVGFVEGMIHLLVSQRQGLASGAKSLASLQAAIQQVENLGDVEKNLRLLHSEKKQTWSRVLPWLVRVLEMGVHLVNIHGSLGGENTDLVVQALQRWVDRFHEHLSKLQNLSECPEKITTEAHLEAETAFSLDVQMMDEELQQISESKPEMGYIVKHISLWSQVDSCALDKHVSQSSLVEFGDVISRLCDKILVAVETIERLGNEVTANEDEPGWFMKRAGLSASIIKKLHIDTITSDINNAIEEIQNIDLTKAEKSTTVMAILGLASPILDQYHVLCRQSTSRLLEIHGATSKLAFYLTKTFTQMASQGFCTPQEKSDEKSGDAGNVESGTGLGDGEGAEDISKDIKEDEDLTELAQEANKEKNGEIEDEKDAVDMADEEMEGEMGSVTGEDEEETDSKDGDDEKEEDDMDEEAGDVDDLDPTAVDEKMWDGKDEEKADKDQLGDKAKGQKNDDEQMAADENSKKDEVKDNQGQDQDKDDEQQDPDIPEDEPEEAKAQEELNKQEQTAEEKDTLAMPEDMELDLGDDDAMSSDSDDLDLPSDAAEEHNEVDDAENNGSDDGDIETEKPKEAENGAEDDTEEDPEDEVKVKGDDEVQDEVDPEKDAEEDTNMEDELEQQHPHQKDDSAITDNENAAQSDVKSSGIDENGESMELDDDFRDSTAQREQGEMGQSAADQETSAGNKGSDLKRETAADEQDQNQEQDRDDKESARADPFKKLGDALERWHRQQSDIKETDANDQQSDQKQLPEADQGRKEFQHLQDDDAAPDDQALGTADDDQVQPIDESMAIDEEKKDPSSRLMDEEKDEPANDKMDNLDDDDVAEADEKNTREPDTSRSGVKTRQGNFEDEQTSSDEEKQTQEREEDETIEETSTQLSTTHISAAERELRDFGQCMQQWVEFQSKTNPLALSLTSQLRLILTPSQSTKLSGSFRTGKRLSIKRIIPYIASSYKRDKIWMRRSIPTKRTYQILLCVDDSRSMGESSSGSLALESLVMVSRSLTMLEAGQVGVVGFGSDVFTAHALTEPFAADAGAKVLQRFSFSQDRTDVALLIRQTIDTFRTARQQSGGNSDLWQLSLILSDGLTPSSAHDSIRRLLREAIEERIMIVFIIMDDTEQKKGDSVLELKEARFVNEGGESRVLIERYLDTFPFQYYLIVHNLEELPNALAGLLRTWFAEVAP
jgi:midasin